jgi:hypothetical protein
VTVDNPYWTEVRDSVTAGDFPWEGPCVARFRFDMLGDKDPGVETLDRHEFVGKYSWSIPDPVSLDFVAQHVVGGAVDPLAGTGYWAYLLGQLNVDVTCYDLQPGSNPWHRDEALWTEVVEMDGADAAAKHADRTLILAWPPYGEDVGTRVLRAYRGERVIYIGELNGCCGDDDMLDELDENWEAVAQRAPVQWWGLHDRITVYERKTVELVEAALASEASALHTGTEWISEVPTDDTDRRDLVPAMQGGSS